MRIAMHSLRVAILGLAMVLVLAVGWMTPPAVRLVATALIMGPTLVPNPGNHYMNLMTDNYITPYFGRPTSRVPVHTPAQLWPIASTDPLTFDWNALTFDQSVAGGLASLKDVVAAQPSTQPLVIVGYSQSTRTGTAYKKELIAQYGDDFAAYPDIGFVLVSNLNKPNGGILERGAILPFFSLTIPIFGITFDGATPTNSPVDPSDSTDHALHTVDFSVLYDGVSDAPVYVNPLTALNALLGFFYLHDYPPRTADGPFYQGSKGDTDYYIYRSTDLLPILRPLEDYGIPRPLLLALDEPLRVVIETTGYRRDVNPGEPTPFGLVPIINPITFAWNLIQSIPVGLDNAFEDLGSGRPFGTQPSGPFGVGGPALPDPPALPVTPVTPAPVELQSLSATVDSDAPGDSSGVVSNQTTAAQQPEVVAGQAAEQPGAEELSDVLPGDPSPSAPIVRNPIGQDRPDEDGPRRTPGESDDAIAPLAQGSSTGVTETKQAQGDTATDGSVPAEAPKQSAGGDGAADGAAGPSHGDAVSPAA